MWERVPRPARRARAVDGAPGNVWPDGAELASRMLAGDEAAFNAFFDVSFPRLYRFALARVGRDTSAAEDVVQATLARAVAKLHTYRGEASLLTWLYTICRHEISDHYARRGRFPAAELTDDNPEVRSALESLGAGLADPERAALRGEVSRFVQAVLDTLPPHYADALEWKYLLGLSIEEIAARLDLSRKAAESLLTRARVAFRAEFSGLDRVRGHARAARGAE